MHDLLFAAKRQFRAGFLLCLLLAALLPNFARGAGHQTALRPCGLYCADSGSAYDALAAQLESDGFLLYESREALTSDVTDGTLNCGAVLEPGLEERLASDALSGAVTLYTSSMTYLPEAAETQLQARLFAASDAARTEKAIRKAGAAVEAGTVEAELESLYAQGMRFTFTVETVSGSPMADTGRAVGLRLAQAACALLLFAAMLPAVRREMRETARIAARIGTRGALLRLLLPSVFWLIAADICAGLCAGMPLAGLTAYLLCLLCWGVVFAAVPEQAAGAVMVFWLLGSMVLLPVWVDAADVLPAAQPLRYLFPASLFPEMLENPLPYAAAAAAVLLAAVLISVRRRRNA